jgi:drug/metabolite transporter (DMT)-like permease
MIDKKSEGRYHGMAVFVMSVWGVTYISTKVLLANGLSPAGIMFLRFLMAYLAIWFVAPKRVRSESWRDEGLFALLGIFGGSLYFQTENLALRDTLASNVALILCTAPLWTALLSHFFVRGGRLRAGIVWGSLCALSGVALVIFNGHFILKISPKGDLLCLLSALSWAVYTILLRKVNGRYSNLFITRKVFFYGLLTLLPVFFFSPPAFDPAVLLRPVVAGNLLFLGLLASLLCYILWNNVVRQLGGVRANNYIYGSPLVTLIASAIILDERITWAALLGAVLIIGGVWLAERKQ